MLQQRSWNEVGCEHDTHQCCEHWGGCPTNSHASGVDGTARMWSGSAGKEKPTWLIREEAERSER